MLLLLSSTTVNSGNPAKPRSSAMAAQRSHDAREGSAAKAAHRSHEARRRQTSKAMELEIPQEPLTRNRKLSKSP